MRYKYKFYKYESVIDAQGVTHSTKRRPMPRLVVFPSEVEAMAILDSYRDIKKVTLTFPDNSSVTLEKEEVV